MAEAAKKQATFKVAEAYEGDTSVDLSDPFYSEANMRWLEESDRQLREGRVIVKTMEELEAMAR